MQFPCAFRIGFVVEVGQLFRLLVTSHPGLVSAYNVYRFLRHHPCFIGARQYGCVRLGLCALEA